MEKAPKLFVGLVILLLLSGDHVASFAEPPAATNTQALTMGETGQIPSTRGS